MNSFVIICDSACDLSKEMLDRFKIDDIVKYSLTFHDGNDQEILPYFENISEEEFYKNMTGPGIYKTGAPSPEKFIVVFEKYLKEGKDILYISISSGMSSAYQSSLVAKEELLKKYPERKIYSLDSKCYSNGELHLIIRAKELKDSNTPIDQAYETLLEFRDHIHQTGPMDDLIYLAKCGRISNSKAFLGTIIGVNPIGEINSDGMPTPLIKVKGGKKALKVSTEYIKRTILYPERQAIIIAHTNRYEKALAFKELIEKEINPKEVILCSVGPTCATNIGPGLCGAFYYGEKISKDLSSEKQLYEKITKEIK